MRFAQGPLTLKRKGRDTMAGEVEETKGRIKEAAGDLTGDKDLENEGKADKIGGKIKGAIDTLKDKLTGRK